MKIYTEEQVKSMLNGIIGERNVPGFLHRYYTPIELPSNEEIEDKGKWVFNDEGHSIFTHYNTVPSWVAGAKWMRDKIQGGGK